MTYRTPELTWKAGKLTRKAPELTQEANSGLGWHDYDVGGLGVPSFTMFYDGDRVHRKEGEN